MQGVRSRQLLPGRSGELTRRSNARCPCSAPPARKSPAAPRLLTVVYVVSALPQAAPLPCSGGTYSSSTTNDHATDCDTASAGYFATTGSIAQTECAKGTYTNDDSTDPKDKCTACGGGKFQDTEGATACKACTSGYYCTDGAAAALPCPKGTRQNLGLPYMDEESDCIDCKPGTFCPVGSESETDCTPGTYNPNEKQESCFKCAAGKFQEDEGATACLDCTPSYYCKEGAAAALPCPGGRHKNLTLTRPMESEEDCVICPPGTFCSVGSKEPLNCAPGTYNNQHEQEICSYCDAGTFQENVGASACEACKPGYYCSEGAAAALPCLAGSFSTATDLSNATQCTPCPLGRFCVSGATASNKCSVANYAGQMGKSLCDGCLEGSYQDDEGSSACKTW